MLAQLARALEVIQQIVPSDERTCIQCEHFDDQSKHCSQWAMTVPKDAIKIGCEKWSKLIPF